MRKRPTGAYHVPAHLTPQILQCYFYARDKCLCVLTRLPSCAPPRSIEPLDEKFEIARSWAEMGPTLLVRPAREWMRRASMT